MSFIRFSFFIYLNVSVSLAFLQVSSNNLFQFSLIDSSSCSAVCSQEKNLEVRRWGSWIPVLTLTMWKAPWMSEYCLMRVLTLHSSRLSATLCARIISLMWMFFSSRVSLSSMLCSQQVLSLRSWMNLSRSLTSLILPEKSMNFFSRSSLFLRQRAVYSPRVYCSLCSFSSSWMQVSSIILCSLALRLSSSSLSLPNCLQKISSFFMREMICSSILVSILESSYLPVISKVAFSFYLIAFSTSSLFSANTLFFCRMKSISLFFSCMLDSSRRPTFDISSQSFRIVFRYLDTIVVSSSLQAERTFNRWVSQSKFSLELSNPFPFLTEGKL